MSLYIHFVILLLVLVSTISNAQPKVPENQKEALIDFYNTFGGNNWVSSKNWYNDALLCLGEGWFGVSCRVNPKEPFRLDVFQLTFNGNNLNGSFDTFQGWGNWTLQYLFLNDNHLTGSIPDSFWDINSQLVQFQVSGNKLDGTISPNIGDLPALAQFQAVGNSFQGTLPPSLFNNLTSMTMILLGNNKLTGSIPIEYAASARTLTYLDLSSNFLKDKIPEAIWDYTALQILLLSGSPGSTQSGLTGTISPNISKLQSLQILSLSDNLLEGTIPDSILTVGTLQELSIFNNKVSGTIPTGLDSLVNLRLLTLGKNKLTGRIPDTIWSLTNIELLDLGLNALTGSIPPEISQLQKLQVINLKGIPYETNPGKFVLNGSLPDALYTISSLKTIFLSFNNLGGTLSPSIQNLEHLETLALDHNNFGGSVPIEIYGAVNLSTLLLSKNSLSGSISPNIGLLTKILSLELQRNKFEGFIPEYFNTTRSFPQKLLLASNTWTCPITDIERKYYGATCVTPGIVNAQPSWIFNGKNPQVTVISNRVPLSLGDSINCRATDALENVLKGPISSTDNQIICYFPSHNFTGPFTIGLYLTDILITTTSAPVVSFFGVPTITEISQVTEREQGSNRETMVIYGNGFVDTGNLVCMFGENRSSFAAFINDTSIECTIPAHPPGTVLLRVANYPGDDNSTDEYLSNSISFSYYAWCDGFPVCGGPARGECINETERKPYCLCNTSGFDVSTYCFDCLPSHFGATCDVCKECYNGGDCNDGYSGNGGCTCGVWYVGDQCTIMWGYYAGPGLGGIIIIAILVIVIKGCVETFKKEKTTDPTLTRNNNPEEPDEQVTPLLSNVEQ